jgi:hypothetical protein
MAALSLAVTATGAVLGGGSIAQCMNVAYQNKQVEVSPDAVIKSLGIVMCHLRGKCMRVRRHVTLIGDLLVVSYRPGSANRMIPLKGVQVVSTIGDRTVKLIDASGSVPATFWLESEEQCTEWSEELKQSNLPTAAVSKFLSINRQQREQLAAETAEWEEEIRRVQANPDPDQAVMLQLQNIREAQDSKVAFLQDDLEKYKEMPKMLSLNRRQIAEMESMVQQTSAQLDEVQNKLGEMQALPKILSLKKKQVSVLEETNEANEVTVAQLQSQLQRMQDIPKIFSLERKEAASMEAALGEKESMISTLQANVVALASEIPKMVSSKRKVVMSQEQKVFEKESRIRALEMRLQASQGTKKIMSFNRKQVEQLEMRSKDKLKELEELRKKLAQPPSASVGA